MVDAFVVKRLTHTEVDPATSHQHEFHAGKIRLALDLPAARITAGLAVEYYADGHEPEAEEGWYTLSNVREGRPRPPEYHMYYSSPLIDQVAKPGDLLLLVRPSDGLDVLAVVAERGSKAEASILEAVFRGEAPDLAEFRIVEPSPVEESIAGSVVASLTAGPGKRAYEAAKHPLYARAIARDALPPVAEMRAAADELARIRHGRQMDADTYVASALEAETELYYAISEVIFQRGLDELISSGARYPQIAKYVSDRNQGAKTRRGESLQNHFDTVLRDRGIPHSAQCETERGEIADFVLPGCREYHDAGYDGSRLRMVGCKSTLKDRWRQVLNAADRVQRKHVLTLDRRLTGTLVANLERANLAVFLPASTIRDCYDSSSFRSALGSIEQLLDDVTSGIR